MVEMSLTCRDADRIVTASSLLHFSCGFSRDSLHSGLPGEVNREAYRYVSEHLFLRPSLAQAACMAKAPFGVTRMHRVFPMAPQASVLTLPAPSNAVIARAPSPRPLPLPWLLLLRSQEITEAVLFTGVSEYFFAT